MIIHNTAVALSFLLSELHYHHENGTNGIVPKVGIGMGIALFLSAVLTIAVSTSTKFPNQIVPVPKFAVTVCTLVTFRCVSYNRLSKFILHFGIWIVVNVFVMCVCYHLPMMFIAVLTDLTGIHSSWHLSSYLLPPPSPSLQQSLALIKFLSQIVEFPSHVKLALDRDCIGSTIHYNIVYFWSHISSKCSLSPITGQDSTIKLQHKFFVAIFYINNYINTISCSQPRKCI